MDSGRSSARTNRLLQTTRTRSESMTPTKRCRPLHQIRSYSRTFSLFPIPFSPHHRSVCLPGHRLRSTGSPRHPWWQPAIKTRLAMLGRCSRHELTWKIGEISRLEAWSCFWAVNCTCELLQDGQPPKKKIIGKFSVYLNSNDKCNFLYSVIVYTYLVSMNESPVSD